jgi:hypothetical protein
MLSLGRTFSYFCPLTRSHVNSLMVMIRIVTIVNSAPRGFASFEPELPVMVSITIRALLHRRLNPLQLFSPVAVGDDRAH